MVDFIKGREQIVSDIKAELMGPNPMGEEVSEEDLENDDFIVEDKYAFLKIKKSGEEIISEDPKERYNIGLLWPNSECSAEEIHDNDISRVQYNEAEVNEMEDVQVVKEKETNFNNKDLTEENLDLVGANKIRQSVQGITTKISKNEKKSMLVISSNECGRYERIQINYRKEDGQIESLTRWKRVAYKFEEKFSISKLLEKKIIKKLINNTGGLTIEIYLHSRLIGNDIYITSCLINRTQPENIEQPEPESCLFQTKFRVSLISGKVNKNFLSIDKVELKKQTSSDPEKETLELLYRNLKNYGIGHGCSADWIKDKNKTLYVISEPLPVFKAPNISPDVMVGDTKLRSSMRKLSGLGGSNKEIIDELKKVTHHYGEWIKKKELEINEIENFYHEAANRNIKECKLCLDRMDKGINFLKNNEKALKAFKLANHAILLQQFRHSGETRKLTVNSRGDIEFKPPLCKKFIKNEKFNYIDPDKKKGFWRPFQLAFLLVSVKSSITHDKYDEEKINDRKNVELIFFPTGGGKTEAYFGLSAFSIFYRRLKNPDDIGVNVLMRYTLRLLTAQQFQRASTLICAMDFLRKKNEVELGSNPISIGIWLGGENTPNKRSEARSNVSNFRNYKKNLMLVTKCPWCNGELGHIFDEKKRYIDNYGYERNRERSIDFKCQDSACDFHLKPLPILVVDEDIYEKKPSLLIGTIDKFTLLAWNPQVRHIFGINEKGERQFSPPSLIIQDELHLITGPLGSLSGIYEGLIEELSTDRTKPIHIMPKIICSTATIRQYQEQITCLYSRDRKFAKLFPPHGISIDDNFFSTYARVKKNGEYDRPKYFVGINGSGMGSSQKSQVNTYSVLLQAASKLPQNERDPWHTLLCFFNSLRELGTTVTLLQSDIPNRLKRLHIRRQIERESRRYINMSKCLQLSGNSSNQDVWDAIRKLNLEYGDKQTVDVCLASNIVEVGVDIPRLSLITIFGQPKTSSSYIQVTGRIGREWESRPGLVVTIYGTARPRDRSHFEQFRSYHETLYSKVEPTSVTPFARPVLERALHAAMVSFVRQFGQEEDIKRPTLNQNIRDLLKNFINLYLKRIEIVDKEQAQDLEEIFKKRLRDWESFGPQVWQDGEDSLLNRAGFYLGNVRTKWDTPISMRNVDAECRADITDRYALQRREESEEAED